MRLSITSERNEKMNSRNALTEPCLVAVLSLLALPALCGPVSGGDYYTEPLVYSVRPDPAKEMALDCIGSTGIKARFARFPKEVARIGKAFAEAMMKMQEN